MRRITEETGMEYERKPMTDADAAMLWEALDAVFPTEEGVEEELYVFKAVDGGKLVDGYGCGWENSEKYDLVCHGGETNSYYCLNYVLHPAGKRTYFLILTCCNSDDEEDEDEDETAEAADNEAEFNQYQTIFDIVKKHLL